MNDGTVQLATIRGKVDLNMFGFAYNNAEYVLKDINIKINPGETVALVGQQARENLP